MTTVSKAAEELLNVWVSDYVYSTDKEARDELAQRIAAALTEARKEGARMALEAAADAADGYAADSHNHGYVDASSYHAALKQGATETASTIRALDVNQIVKE